MAGRAFGALALVAVALSGAALAGCGTGASGMNRAGTTLNDPNYFPRGRSVGYSPDPPPIAAGVGQADLA